MKILYFNHSAFGGLAQYAHCQANAFVDEGCEVEFLCAPNFQDYGECRYSKIPVLSTKTKRANQSKWSRFKGFYKEISSDIKRLAEYIDSNQHNKVLFGSYFEYFAPLWVRTLKTRQKRGVVFGSVVHDPIRDAQMGPLWWHNLSIRKAYEFLDILFLHQTVNDPQSFIPEHLHQYIIPHGPYKTNAQKVENGSARSKLNLPDDKLILLAFGHLRDNKNLDLAINSLKDHPEIHLVVAGQSLNKSQQQPEYYQNLAYKLGVNDQISWFIEYIPDDQVSLLFSAADGILLTYSKGFRSASGVLNLAIAFEIPCIASSGPSALEEQVKKYNLGVWVEPDDQLALNQGMGVFKKGIKNPIWSAYKRDNSWELNANITLEAFRKQSAVSGN